MKKLFADERMYEVVRIQSLLTERKIDSFIRNEWASGAAGEISPFDAWPELWVVEEGDYQLALSIVEADRNRTVVRPEKWRCPDCHEENTAAFEFCWNCNADPDEK